MKNRNKIITLCVIPVLVICVITIFIFNKINTNKGVQAEKEIKFETHIASTPTETVGRLIPNIRSDLIIDVPEEYFLDFNNNDMTYEDLVSEIGEPSGTVGSGIVRDYWRIGEDKYAVLWIEFEIWHGNK